MITLLNTYMFLWWITDDSRLSVRACAIISCGEYELSLSVASSWEIAIEAKLERLQLLDDPGRFTFEQMALKAIESLLEQMSHALYVHALLDYRRDHLDRILIAQSQFEKRPRIHSRSCLVRVIWRYSS